MELHLPLKLFKGDRPIVELYLELAVFSGGCNWGVSAPCVVTSSTGLHSKRYLGIGLSRVEGETGVFWNLA